MSALHTLLQAESIARQHDIGTPRCVDQCVHLMVCAQWLHKIAYLLDHPGDQATIDEARVLFGRAG